MPTSEVARTSYKFGCGSVSQSLDRNRVCLRYALTFLFSLCIFCTKCLANILEFYFQDWPFEDAESQPTLGYNWSNITNVTSTLKVGTCCT
jgi:hypothetical protein